TKKALAFGQAKYAAYQAAQADAIAAKSAEALAQASEIAAFTALEKAKAKEAERLAFDVFLSLPVRLYAAPKCDFHSTKNQRPRPIRLLEL
ncbi:MAG: hypothetical protein FWH15_06470, partial [Betaproteobacteria bacterium]|nr:hypothetical protein [Betaproteobacteria bacterium]